LQVQLVRNALDASSAVSTVASKSVLVPSFAKQAHSPSWHPIVTTLPAESVALHPARPPPATHLGLAQDPAAAEAGGGAGLAGVDGGVALGVGAGVAAGVGSEVGVGVEVPAGAGVESPEELAGFFDPLESVVSDPFDRRSGSVSPEQAPMSAEPRNTEVSKTRMCLFV
jgi:hypothetical protein